MTNPMYCPMSFGRLLPGVTRCDGVNEKEPVWFECTPDCAWSVIINDGSRYACIIAAKEEDQDINSRPLEDDVND